MLRSAAPSVICPVQEEAGGRGRRAVRAHTLGFSPWARYERASTQVGTAVKACATRLHLLSVTLILGLEGTQEKLSFKPSQYSGPLSQCAAPRACGCSAQECCMVIYLSTLRLWPRQCGPPHGSLLVTPPPTPALREHTCQNAHFRKPHL